MTDTVRVYVNGRGVDVPAEASVLDAVRLADAGEADRVSSGDRALTDSRGLPLDPASGVSGGTIVRTVSGRRRGAADA
jgi:hypothetical protein